MEGTSACQENGASEGPQSSFLAITPEDQLTAVEADARHIEKLQRPARIKRISQADSSHLLKALERYDAFECGQKAIHFFSRVVVYEPNAQEAAGLFYVKALGQVERVVVSIPGEEALIA
jgi:hypothetical protein